jgi:hypothetical protein
MPAVPVVTVVPTVPVRFFDPLARRACADNGLVQGRHCGSTTFPESQGAERNSGCDCDFCKACTHKNFSELNPIDSRNVAAQL